VRQYIVSIHYVRQRIRYHTRFDVYNQDDMEDEIVLRGIVILVIEVFIIINARNLGWNVEIKDDHELVLTKPSQKLTDIDKDTGALMKKLAGGFNGYNGFNGFNGFDINNTNNLIRTQVASDLHRRRQK